MYSFSMVVPVFNEEELLEDFVRKSVSDLSRVSKDFEIILIDDGSTDRSREIEKRLAEEFPQIKLIFGDKNRGSACMVAGYQSAVKEIVFNNTVDAQFHTDELPLIIPHLEGVDCVSCYRTNLKANTLKQKILTMGNVTLIKLLFPMIKLKAYQTMQFHRRDFFQKINIRGRSLFIAPEMLFKEISLGRILKEVPFTFYPRAKGKSKGGRLIRILETFRDIFKFWFLWVVLRRPVAVFENRKFYLRS